MKHQWKYFLGDSKGRARFNFTRNIRMVPVRKAIVYAYWHIGTCDWGRTRLMNKRPYAIEVQISFEYIYTCMYEYENERCGKTLSIFDD